MADKAITIGHQTAHIFDDTNWNIIFQTPAGLDYCREQLPATMSLDDVKAWTTKQLDSNSAVATATIELW